MIQKFEEGKVYKFIPELGLSQTYHKVSTCLDMEDINKFSFVTCEKVGKESTHIKGKGCFYVKFRELENFNYWSIEDFEEYNAFDAYMISRMSTIPDGRSIKCFETGKKYKVKNSYIVQKKDIGTGSSEFFRDSMILKQREVIICTEGRSNFAKFDCLTCGWYWDLNAFEEANKMDEIKLDECSKANLAEAKKQFEQERNNSEIAYAKQQLRTIQDRIDTLDREISRRQEEKDKLLESLKVFK